MVKCGVPSADLSAAAARRIALAAQGFGQPRPTGPVTARHIRKVVDTMGLLQLDSVNVLSRSHYLPVFARLGPYPREILDRLTGHTAGRMQREYVEYWAHEASLVPLATHPLLRWRMARARPRRRGAACSGSPGNSRSCWTRSAGWSPSTGRSAAPTLELERRPKKPGEMWNWHDGKVALEYLFWAGEVGAAAPGELRAALRPDRAGAAGRHRRPADPDPRRRPARAGPDRCPRATASPPSPTWATTSGCPGPTPSGGSPSWSRPASCCRSRSPAGTRPATCWPEARRPRRVQARALLSPFDPLIWFRDRAKRLFGFHYRIEIYTPAAQRVHGYYVLPFLLGETLVGRVDLKADRQAGVLRVQSAWGEPDVEHGEVAEQLAASWPSWRLARARRRAGHRPGRPGAGAGGAELRHRGAELGRGELARTGDGGRQA